MNPDALRGKVVVIIGGTTGLGLAAARACLVAGGSVVVAGRDAETSDTARQALGGGPVKVVTGDPNDPNTTPRAIEAAVTEYGGFDALYHAAGGSGRSTGDGPLHELTDAGWDLTIQSNLTSLVCANRAAVRQFLKQDRPGSVLNISSAPGAAPSPRYFAAHAYAAATSAVEGLTLSCAAYYAKHDIRFNAIAPGLIETRVAARATEDDAVQRFIRTKQPLDGGRIGQTADLDAAVVFFLSDQSKFVTGQVLAIDGGWSVTEGQYPVGQSGNSNDR